MKTKKQLFNIMLLLTLAISACAPSASLENGLLDNVSIRPIDEIIQQPIQVTDFTNDGSARLPIQTTIPVACTIVYGKTPAFGSLSLDQDMAGGPHTDHNPLLSGLEPETTYYFRVQGVDASGVIYLSDMMNFTTPRGQTSEVQNLASPLLGAEITGISSAYGNAGLHDHWGAAGAFDDNPNTEWSSAGDGNNAWIEVRLARPALVTAFSFHSRSMSDGSAITLAFTVTTETGEILGPFEVVNALQPYTFETSFIAQTLKFELTNTTGGNTGVVDIVVSGEFIE
jgi:hypothetical protein